MNSNQYRSLESLREITWLTEQGVQKEQINPPMQSWLLEKGLLTKRLRSLCGAHFRLEVLHGPGADWDFGYVDRDDADVPGLLAALVEALGDDRVDLADLGRASGLLRYHAARDGQLLFEATPDAFDRFRLDATRFWCDVAPMLKRGYAEVLEALSP